MSTKVLRLPSWEPVQWAALFWIAVAATAMPCVAFLKPLEVLATVVLLCALVATFLAPNLRAPAAIFGIVFYPRTVEYDPVWSLVLSMREPSPDVRIPALVSPLDAALLLLALSVLLPAWYRRSRIGSYGSGWGLAFLGVLLCAAVLGGGKFGPPYDAEFLAGMNLLRIACVWVVLTSACEQNPRLPGLTFLVCGLAVCASGVWNYLSASTSGSAADVWYARGQAFNMNANSFSATMVMVGLLGLTLASIANRKWERWIGLAAFAIGAVGVAVALSRAGILLFALMVTALLLTHRRKWLLSWLVIVGIVVVYVLSVPEVNGRVALLQSGGEVLEDHARALIYPQALAMLQDNWLLGVGPYRFFDASIPYLPVGIFQFAAHAHSLPLQILVDTGVFGALFAGLFALSLVRRAWRTIHTEHSHRAWRIAGFWAAAAGLLLQLTDSLYLDYRFCALWLVPIAMSVASVRSSTVIATDPA
ncbi:MAG: O-antigen ligase family protein [Fimbriimonadia bacterium]